MDKLSFLSATISCFVLTCPAMAQEGSRIVEQMRAADANHDGAITRNELVAYRATQFGRIDRNGDGVITDADMPPIQSIKKRLESAVRDYDINKDGKVSRNEFVNGPTPMFDRVDTNKDNVLSQTELEHASAAIESARAK